MISFINAKINIGLNIIRRRSDGYHDLRTLFYPVGIYAGTPENEVSFSDILEIVPLPKPVPEGQEPFEFIFKGRKVECDFENNLVVKAARLFNQEMISRFSRPSRPFRIILFKFLPDGAGLGGGSADASFVLKMLNTLNDNPFVVNDLLELALRLGADCPFFILDVPCFAEGVGERLTPSDISLKGKWLALVKPDIYISTKEAFAGINPRIPELPLEEALKLPMSDWRDTVFNDFEDSIFPNHPQLRMIKDSLYDSGALYASMSGSGSSIYGIFPDRLSARNAVDDALSQISENSNAFSSVLKM